ncbi:unnamed protein product [Caenorhabditis auriculariae]|uniref:Uncharacterized protein n=1 Tax=Caenorhabditis auriculariae TaxID=2777116 RepID=A0A8S1HJM2_9PELO|nr:unnamed protein product [Caenorhabditis auriculariae]
MTHYEPPFKPDPIAYSMGGGKAEKLQKKHEEEAEKGKTKTTVNETVDILTFEYPSRVGSGENRGKAGVESKPLGANPIGPTPSKELSDSTHPLRNFKAEDDGFRMNVVNGMKKLEAGQGIDKTLGRMWMHLGLIKCLIAEQENQCELHEKVLTSSLISLSQLVAIERLERLGVNTRTAYAGLVDRTGKPVHAVKDMHEFYHLLQRLRVEARPEDKKLLELLEKHDLRRRFELMEVGEQYEDNVGKLIFLPPAFTIKDGFLSMIEKNMKVKIGKDYDEAKNLVDKYAKKNKIELRQKPATSTKVLKFKNVVQDLPMVALKNQPETPQKRTAYTTIRSLEKIVNPKTLLEKTETIVNETKTPREATPKTAVTKEETAFPSREAVTQQTVSGTKDVENLREAETQNEIETQRTTQQTTQQETTIEKTK